MAYASWQSLRQSTAEMRADPVLSSLRRLPRKRSIASGVLENAGKRVKVAGVAGLPAQDPVFSPPEEVRVQPKIRPPSPPHALVVVLNHLLWHAAAHRPAVRIWRRCHSLPRFGLPLGDHQAPSTRAGPREQLPLSSLVPAALGAVKVQRHLADAHQRVARIVVDAHDIGET